MVKLLFTFRGYLPELLLFRRIVGLDRLCLDDHTRVTLLVVLALVRDCPRHVTTRQHYASQNDCHQ